MYRNMIYCHHKQQAFSGNVTFGLAEGESGYDIVGFFVGCSFSILAAINVSLLVVPLAIGSSTITMIATGLGLLALDLGFVGVICSFIGCGQLANSMAPGVFCESNYWGMIIQKD